MNRQEKWAMVVSTHAERANVRARAGRISWCIDRHGGYLRKLIRRLAHRVNDNEVRLAELEQATFDQFASLRTEMAVIEERLRLRETRLPPPS